MKSRLASILSSRVRAEIFRLLFGLAPKSLHVREIVRQSGLSLGAVRQDLGRLLELELVAKRRDGNRLYYRANQDHPLYPVIRDMVLKTTGLVDALRESLGAEGIQVAFVFGSGARGDLGAESDVDLMVIGDINLREVSRRLSGVSERIGREINPHTVRAAEFAERRTIDGDFVSRVAAGPRLFVIGDVHDLEAMV